MGAFLRTAQRVILDAAKGWQRHHATRMAAALAYYGILSLTPLTVIAVAIAGLVYGRRAAEGLLVEQLSSLVGSEAATLVQAAVAQMYARGGGVLAIGIAALVVLYGASGLIGNLRSSLNSVWDVESRSQKGLVWILLARLLDVGVALAAGVFFLGGMVIQTALATLAGLLPESLPLPSAALQLLGSLVSVALVGLFLMVLFRVLPNAGLSWADVWLGAAISAVLFTLGNLAVSFYLARAATGSVFGAAGSLVVIMVWMYYVALIVLFGAEVTRALAQRRRQRDR